MDENLEYFFFLWHMLEFFLNMGLPGLFFVYFQSAQTSNTTFKPNQCELMSCPSTIRHRDSNPRPLEHMFEFECLFVLLFLL